MIFERASSKRHVYSSRKRYLNSFSSRTKLIEYIFRDKKKKKKNGKLEEKRRLVSSTLNECKINERLMSVLFFVVFNHDACFD